jgi:hypothetical protein
MNYTRFEKKSRLMCIGLMLFLCGEAQDSLLSKNQVALWQSKPVSVDGNDNDWPKVFQLADKKAKISYALANDESTFYLCLITNDIHTKLKILAGGLTTYINTEGKKKQSMAIIYPERIEELQIAPGRPDLRGLIVTSMANLNQYELEGFSSGNGKYFSTQENEAGIKVRVGLNDSAELVYEASIPFTALKIKQPKASDAASLLAVGFVIKGLSKTSTSQNSPVPDGGTRRAAPAGSLGSMPAGQNDDRLMFDLFENSKTWQIIALATAGR